MVAWYLGTRSRVGDSLYGLNVRYVPYMATLLHSLPHTPFSKHTRVFTDRRNIMVSLMRNGSFEVKNSIGLQIHISSSFSVAIERLFLHSV